MRLYALLFLLVLMSCQHATHADVTGTYQLVSPHFNNAVGKLLDQRITLTSDRAIISTGTFETTGKYKVENGFVYLVSGETRFGYQIISRDTLRYDGPLSLEPLNYIRIKP